MVWRFCSTLILNKGGVYELDFHYYTFNYVQKCLKFSIHLTVTQPRIPQSQCGYGLVFGWPL